MEGSRNVIFLTLPSLLARVLIPDCLSCVLGLVKLISFSGSDPNPKERKGFLLRAIESSIQMRLIFLLSEICRHEG